MAKCNSEDKMTVWGKMVCSEVCNSWFTARGHSISKQTKMYPRYANNTRLSCRYASALKSLIYFQRTYKFLFSSPNQILSECSTPSAVGSSQVIWVAFTESVTLVLMKGIFMIYI